MASRILKTFSSQLGVSVGESVPPFYCLIVRTKIILSIGNASPSHRRLMTFHTPKPWALISLTFITSATIVPVGTLHLSLSSRLGDTREREEERERVVSCN